MLCVLEKNVYSATVGWNIRQMSVRSTWSIPLFKSSVSSSHLALFWLSFAWNIFFYPFTFRFYLSLSLKWVSYSLHRVGSWFFLIHSAIWSLLIREFNPFTFKIIIDMEALTTVILFIVFCLSCSSFVPLFLSCCLPLCFIWFFSEIELLKYVCVCVCVCVCV